MSWAGFIVILNENLVKGEKNGQFKAFFFTGLHPPTLPGKKNKDSRHCGKRTNNYVKETKGKLIILTPEKFMVL